MVFFFQYFLKIKGGALVWHVIQDLLGKNRVVSAYR
ncbi:hypothetical protein SAMN05518683_11655 [Salibacterium halotolerans]|uniref:Uncharacterized protein n=1 Tax=Salibacterium halotolerans TaxID=1884432 RepID=A0A1I5VJA5_9BACI|nr:hypothetical protein SAMN05518683_11655 [Salibacterium halotolerans]